MSARFIVSRADEAQYGPVGALAPGAEGLSRWHPIGEAEGAVHTDFGISRLEPGGRVPAHVHSFEESFHVLEGSVILVTPEATVELVAGDYIVLTGDMLRPRDEWHGELQTRGFVPWAAVTKKVKLVAAADPDSLSGKARKARDYGIPIVGEQGLADLLARLP